MKKKIKLRDLTEEQYYKWFINNYCISDKCSKCPFSHVNCMPSSKLSWIKQKDLFTSKFLDQEIEIDVPELLTKEEKEYLENLLRPFKNNVICIKRSFSRIKGKDYITGKVGDDDSWRLPGLESNQYFKNLKLDEEYTLKELGLFEE